MVEPRIRWVDPARESEAVQDLCRRASDYITLETGKPPADDYAAKLLAEAPPTLDPLDVLAFGAEAEGRLCGIATCLRNFYAPQEWYMGLLLLDPSTRNAGLGRRMAHYVFERARSEQGRCIRVAVLEANPRGHRFWKRQGFVHERTVPGDPAGDGHMRHVLKLNWEEDVPCV